MKKIACAAALLALSLSACAPMVWDKAGATQQEFSVDDAKCKLMARGMNPGDFYAQGSTGFVAGAAAVNVIGTAVGQRQTYQECMTASGYTLRQNAAGAAGASPQNTARVEHMKQLAQPAVECLRTAFYSPGAALLRPRTAVNVTELLPAQLSDPAYVSDAEIAAIDFYRPQIKQCRVSFIAQVRAESPVAGSILDEDTASNEALAAKLRAREITWGQYNTQRKTSFAEFSPRYLRAINVQ